MTCKTGQMSRSASGDRVVVAMSGGVDSSVAAALVVQNGFEAIGVTLQLHECDRNIGRACCGIEGVVQAREVTARLRIPHYILSWQREFEDFVLRPAWAEFARGRTPNPCLLCNERIKWGLLLDRTRDFGARWMATGHYARVTDACASGTALLRAKDKTKDQSYFLARLTHDQLKRTLFPIGHLEKKQVRKLARQLDLLNADAPESQDACLVAPGQSFAEMLRHRFDEQMIGGPVIDSEGRTKKFHTGIHQFTIGQRRGLGIAGKSRMWVKAIDAPRAAVLVTSEVNDLLSEGLVASEVRWLEACPDTWPLACDIQVRYRQDPIKASVEPAGPDSVTVMFSRKIRAVTPGQAAVFFSGDRVLGSGWIESAI